MTTYSSQPDETAGIDCMAFEANPTTNYETFATMWLLDNAANRGRGLIKFDLSSIPAGATINSATLSLFHSETVPNNDTIHVRRILAANSGWTESGATWNTRDGTNNWAGSAGCTTSGTDYSSTAMGSVAVTGGQASGTQRDITLDTAEVAAMLANNAGMVLWAAGNSGSFDYQRMHSSSAATAGLRPKLVIDYSATAPDTIGRPIEDITTTSWTATPYWSKLDEVSPDDGDYIQSPAHPSGAVAEVKLGPIIDPASSTGHTVSYRYGKSAASGEQIDLTVSLVQGTTIIQTWTHTNISDTVARADQVLGGTEADSITDYSDLRLRFTASRA